MKWLKTYLLLTNFNNLLETLYNLDFMNDKNERTSYKVLVIILRINVLMITRKNTLILKDHQYGFRERASNITRLT